MVDLLHRVICVGCIDFVTGLWSCVMSIILLPQTPVNSRIQNQAEHSGASHQGNRDQLTHPSLGTDPNPHPRLSQGGGGGGHKRVKRQSYHELNSLSLVRLVWSTSFDLGLTLSDRSQLHLLRWFPLPIVKYALFGGVYSCTISEGCPSQIVPHARFSRVVVARTTVHLLRTWKCSPPKVFLSAALHSIQVSWATSRSYFQRELKSSRPWSSPKFPF